MFKVILSAVVALGLGSVAFADSHDATHGVAGKAMQKMPKKTAKSADPAAMKPTMANKKAATADAPGEHKDVKPEEGHAEDSTGE